MSKPKMLSFNSVEELRDCKELRNMRRYEWKKVLLEGKEIFACTTNQQYEDILWSGVYETLSEFETHFALAENDDFKTDLSSQIRDMILENYEKEGIKLIDVFEEY